MREGCWAINFLSRFSFSREMLVVRQGYRGIEEDSVWFIGIVDVIEKPWMICRGDHFEEILITDALNHFVWLFERSTVNERQKMDEVQTENERWVFGLLSLAVNASHSWLLYVLSSTSVVGDSMAGRWWRSLPNAWLFPHSLTLSSSVRPSAVWRHLVRTGLSRLHAVLQSMRLYSTQLDSLDRPSGHLFRCIHYDLSVWT